MMHAERPYLKLAAVAYFSIGFIFTIADSYSYHGLTGILAGEFDFRDRFAAGRNVLWPLRLLAKPKTQWNAETDKAMEQVQTMRMALHDLVTFNGPAKASASRAFTMANRVNVDELAKVHPHFPSWIQRVKWTCERVQRATPESPVETVFMEVASFEEWYNTECKEKVAQALGW